MASLSGPPDPPDVHLSRSFLAALFSCGVTDAQHDAAMRAASARHGMFWTEDLGAFALQRYAVALADLHPTPHLGLRLARAMPDGATGIVEYVMLTAPSLRATHALHGRYASLTADYMRMELREHGGRIQVEQVPPAGLTLAPLIEEYRVARMLLGTRRALKEPRFSPSSVAFTVPRPSSTAELQEFFGRGAALSFGQERAMLSIPTSVFDQPLPTSDPALHRILLGHAEQMLENAPVPSSTSARVRQALLAQLHTGRPSIVDVGRRLGMSERTLRRRLADEDTSFGELLDEVRASLARVLSRAAEQTEKGVAHKLGFESMSALRRAQKRWAARAPRAMTEH
jgi:AraC-like DNA-binding protein